jgi:hypothetical protein
MKNIRSEIEFRSDGSIFSIFDDVVKHAYNITDDEYDYIAENMTDSELSIFLDIIRDETTKRSSFTDRRNALMIRDKYLNKFNNK